MKRIDKAGRRIAAIGMRCADETSTAISAEMRQQYNLGRVQRLLPVQQELRDAVYVGLTAAALSLHFKFKRDRDRYE